MITQGFENTEGTGCSSSLLVTENILHDMNEYVANIKAWQILAYGIYRRVYWIYSPLVLHFLRMQSASYLTKYLSKSHYSMYSDCYLASVIQFLWMWSIFATEFDKPDAIWLH